MSGRFSQEQGLRAAREGRDIHRYAHEQTVTAGFVVEVAAATYYDIPAGHQVIVKEAFVGCETVDEFVAGYIVACAEVTAGGAATQKSKQLHNHVGTKKEGNKHVHLIFDPPICIKYSDAHRSVSMAVKATDTATVVGFGWCGWVEDEGTLS